MFSGSFRQEGSHRKIGERVFPWPAREAGRLWAEGLLLACGSSEREAPRGGGFPGRDAVHGRGKPRGPVPFPGMSPIASLVCALAVDLALWPGWPGVVAVVA